MGNISRILDNVSIPDFWEIKQSFDNRSIRQDEIGKHVKAILHETGIIEGIKADTKVAITAGSRGISNIDSILKEIVLWVKTRGASPYIIPCMGSHGGNAEGQLKILEGLNITEATMGAPVVASDELVLVGRDKYGRKVFTDKFIAQSESVIVVNRIKPHTAFNAPVESGLQKMMVIGMGKQKGAETCHSEGFDAMYEHISNMADVLFANLNISIGIGIIENSKAETYDIIALRGNEIQEKEPSLLNIARELVPKLYFNNFDILIVEEMGKDISGSGMDTNVIGRYPTSHISGGPEISRIAVLDLTDKSKGNAHGVGFADFISQRVFNKIDMENTYPNCLTNKVAAPAKIPPVMPDDLLTIKAAIKTLKANRDNPKMVLIKNTRNLQKIYISKALYHDALHNPNTEIIGDAFALKFDEQKKIISPFGP